MKLFINLGLSLVVLALCVWVVWPSTEQRVALEGVLRAIDMADFWPYLAAYLGLLAVTHWFRAWRWRNLLRPVGVDLAPGALMGISTIGFMAILALPARLGELARPALLRSRTHASAAVVLGTVAVERIVDGLVVSLLVFVCFSVLAGPGAPGWMMPTAWASLAIFLAASGFLAFALRWPEKTVRFFLAVSMLERLAPRFADTIAALLHKLIRGFLVLGDKKNLAAFVGWSVIYWGANGLGMWVLARGMGLDLSLVGAFATMGLVAVGITLPNSPGLVGQFHWLVTLGLSLYMPKAVAESEGLAYAILLHAIQTLWYMGLGVVAMVVMRVSLSEITGRKTAAALAD